jgi:DNA repair protein RadC
VLPNWYIQRYFFILTCASFSKDFFKISKDFYFYNLWIFQFLCHNKNNLKIICKKVAQVKNIAYLCFIPIRNITHHKNNIDMNNEVNSENSAEYKVTAKKETNDVLNTLKDFGRKHLANAQLLSLIIGTGTTQDIQVAKDLLKSIDNDLNRLGRLTLSELKAFKGMTTKKAAAILACMELGIRREATPLNTKPQITQSSDAYNILKPYLQDLNHEEFVILLLNQGNRVIDKAFISVGGIAGTVVDVKKVFRAALENSLVAGIVLGHNHPSDNLNPSKADIDITKKIKEGGKYLDILVLDHIIVAGNSYTSLADEGLM